MSREGDDLQIGEVGLPKLIDGCGLVLELIGRLDGRQLIMDHCREMKAGLVIRSWDLSILYVEASDTN
jgi:hypothetical protein